MTHRVKSCQTVDLRQKCRPYAPSTEFAIQPPIRLFRIPKNIRVFSHLLRLAPRQLNRAYRKLHSGASGGVAVLRLLAQDA